MGPNRSSKVTSFKFIKALGAKTLLVGSRKEEKEIKQRRKAEEEKDMIQTKQ